MGGGYIHCGDFSGDDKSCSAISGVFEELPSVLPVEARDAFVTDVIEPLQRQLETNGEYFLISPEVSKRLLPVVETLFDRYRTKYGDAEVWDVMENDENSGLDATDAKWGEGPGWRYYCLTDLRTGLKHSIETRTDVCVSFD
jgi:hypothetical protein